MITSAGLVPATKSSVLKRTYRSHWIVSAYAEKKIILAVLPDANFGRKQPF